MQLLKERKDDYLTKDNMILKHFRFPEVFMRRTKNAYISVMFKELLHVIEYSNFVPYNSLRLALRRKNIKMNIYICRKTFGTFLRNEGIETELIDYFKVEFLNRFL